MPLATFQKLRCSQKVHGEYTPSREDNSTFSNTYSPVSSGAT
jgi:hypothetical protein